MKILHYLIATGLGTGYSPIAPGTAGSLLAVLVIYFLSPIPAWILALAMLVLLFIGVYSGSYLEKDFGKDPSKVVVDEIVGMGISLIFVPPDWRLFLIAFLLFRVFDIIKPWPANRMEKLSGGWGIMLDDVFAGFYALLLTHAARILFFN